MTDAWLASEVAGLSRAQQAWTPRPDGWSVTEVVEHLAVAEAASPGLGMLVGAVSPCEALA